MGVKQQSLVPFKGGGVLSYVQRVIAGYSPVAAWAHDELSGSTIVEAVNGYDGSYVSATLGDSTGPDGSPVPRYDGINDRSVLTNASLDGPFNGDAGTFLIWLKVFDVGVWTDGVQRRIVKMDSDGGDMLEFTRHIDNKLRMREVLGGVFNSFTYSGLSFTDWSLCGLRWSWSSPNTTTEGIYEATIGGPRVHAGRWSGSLADFTVGAQTDGTLPWNGWFGAAFLFDSALEQATVTAIEAEATA